MVSVTPVLFAAHKQCQGVEFWTSYFPVLQGAIEALPMADSGFPKRGDVNPWVWGKNLLFGKIFAENCMKMKEIGPEGPVSLAPY